MYRDTDDTQRTALLQYRLSRFGWWGFVLTGGGMLLRVGIAWAISEDLGGVYEIGGHAGTALVLGLMWLVLRGRARYSQAFLVAAEFAGVNLASAGLAIMAGHLPLSADPTMVLMMAMMITFTLRTIYVPSTWYRTLLLSICIGGWILGTAVFILGFVPDGPRQSGIQRGILINTVVWWGFVTLVQTLASRVIYGLRKQVREAEQLGQYSLEKKLGQGGMGVVYRARHAMLRRPTAIKLLPPETTQGRTIERFEREVQRTASLSHPNIVTIFDYGRTPDGVFYYAMELLDGLDLEQLVQAFGPQRPSRVVNLLAQVCDGLQEAHSVGLIHRDIKPANIFLVKQRRGGDLAKLVDFGLVKYIDERSESQRKGESPSSGVELGLTHDNTVTGTPHYLSPEAITRPDAVGPLSDIYALGAVAYFLLTGEQVFEATDVVELCGLHLHQVPMSPSERLGEPLPESLEEVVLRCLEKDPDDRPQSAEELWGLLLSLEDVGGWSTRDAQRWWTEHADATAAISSVETSIDAAPTLQVDLHSRR